MVKNSLQFTVFFLIVAITVAFVKEDKRIAPYQSSSNGTSQLPKTVEEALLLVGDKKPIHYIAKVDSDSARMGEEIVKFGNLLDGSNKRVSKYFVCTDCHNLKLETADPADESPEAVLEFSKKNQIPYLPASTFYSMYNKRHWYNDDYAKKYGDLVIPTRDTLANAIQLCATQCSQGRALEKWEIRTILHYYKSLELQLSDLKFGQNELDKLGNLMVNNKNEAIKLIKSKYNEANHAHFGTNAPPNVPGYTPNADNGKYIYNFGCMHCHDPETGITNFTLSDNELSLGFLYRKRNAYNNYSVTHIARYGTYAMSGRKQYMPMYSFEKLSEKQMLDLLEYIKVGSGH